MTLTIRTDPSRPGGGFALLEGPGLGEVAAISIENGFSGQFLAENGKWGRNPFAFPVEPGPSGSLLLGPHIVDRVPTELQVELRSEGGAALGRLFWADVIPSRNPGSVTSAQVLEDRRRRAAQRVTEEQAAAAAQAALRVQAAEDEVARAIAAEAASQADAEAERRRLAAPKAEQVVPIVASRTRDAISPEPPKRRALWPLLVAVLVMALAAAAALFATKPAMLNSLQKLLVLPTHEPSPAPVVEPTPEPQPEPPSAPNPSPAPKPQSEASTKPPVDCTTFANRVADAQRNSDTEKVALGEEALHSGCGSEAFQAFDSADAQVSEAAAWNLARFYDPDETDPVYRRAASVHPDYAAAYYRMWHDRSPRQAAALAKICEAQRGVNAFLRRYCGR